MLITSKVNFLLLMLYGWSIILAMRCAKCGNSMTQLFTSWACDYCDGLKAAPVTGHYYHTLCSKHVFERFAQTGKHILRPLYPEGHFSPQPWTCVLEVYSPRYKLLGCPVWTQLALGEAHALPGQSYWTGKFVSKGWS